MNLKVAKFGGTSVANAKQLLKVKSIVKSDTSRKYIVTSAPGKRHNDDNKITDLLYLCHAHIKYSVPIDQVFDIIYSRYVEIVEELKLDIDIKSYLNDIKSNFNKKASIDYIVSRGEYLNAIILSQLLNYDFIDASEVIYFDSLGNFDLNKTEKILSKKLSKHPNAVIPGFYGKTPDGKVKVFSRGGSDITGAIIARATNASIYENWTDVSGLLMADPRIVNNPMPISKISYKELRELSYMGANVLHEDAVFPVRDVGIPINIRNTNQKDNPGTLIISENQKSKSENIITGIAGKRDFTVIGIHKHHMNSEIGFVRKLLSILEMHNIYFEHIPSGIDTVSIVISNSLLDDKINSIIDEIERNCKPDSIDVFPNMALIATVGNNMAYTPGIASTLFKSLANDNINIRMIDQGSSEINIIVGVDDKDFEMAINAIYNAFVNR